MLYIFLFPLVLRGFEPPATLAPWGIISVKGQLCDHELPMQPITMMRNALGAEEVCEWRVWSGCEVTNTI